MKRNTGKEKMKENKKFPYKSKFNRGYGAIKWKVSDCDGNEIEEFVSKLAARQFIKDNQRDFFDCDLVLEEI